MSTPRELVWFVPAIKGLSRLLQRRRNPELVREALGQHLQAVAEDPSLATSPDIFEGQTLTYRFRCPDEEGGTAYIQVGLEVLPGNTLAVISCEPVAF